MGATVLPDEQERMLRFLAAELQRFRSMPSPEKPVRLAAPYPGLEPLVGVSAEQVRRLLGEPVDAEPAADAAPGTWQYDFSRRPPHYRGGGLRLELRFGTDATCLVARWRPQR
jgi:hypothetical protein